MVKHPISCEKYIAETARDFRFFNGIRVLHRASFGISSEGLLRSARVSDACKVVVEFDEVAEVLASYGFPPVPDLHAVLVESNLQRSTCTKLDPPSYRGMVTWGTTVRSIRAQQMPNGWTHDDAGNFSRTITPDGARAIVVATGTKGTGERYGTPVTRSPKGPRTLAAIKANVIQLELGPSLIPLAEPEKAEPQTWFWLLRHARTAEGARRVYSELSLPSGLIRGGRIVAWSQRIIVPRLDIDGDGGVQKKTEDGPKFDVPVSRRAS